MNAQFLHFRIEGPGGLRDVTCAARGKVWIGRDDAVGVTLNAKSVSRRHVSIECTSDGLHIEDASFNGTLVDGVYLHRGSMTVPTTTVTAMIGSFRLKVQVVDAAPSVDAPEQRVAKPLAFRQGSELQQRSEGDDSSRPKGRAAGPSTGRSTVELRRGIHRRLLDEMDLSHLDRAAMHAAELRPKVVAALRRIVSDWAAEVGDASAQETLVKELADEAVGLGPLEELLNDPDVNEIMVVDPYTIFAERAGRLVPTSLKFTDDDSVRATIERIVTPLGRRIDESTPLVDARLKDGSRVNAVIPPLALRGPCITIRKFARAPLRMEDLVQLGSLTPEMARFLERSVKVRKNVVISGGTGSGKTTLLNVLSSAIPDHERIVTVEDAAELRIPQTHVVSLEARPPNLEGKGEYSIRDLVKNALRMRPDRIVVGECRSGEALDMLQAMNTGHEGSLTTIHANTPSDAVARIETLCLMAGLDLPIHAIRKQIASSVHVIVQQTRLSDGSRRVTHIAEVVGLGDDGDVELRNIFEFTVKRTGPDGWIEGEFDATGYLPSFLDQFIARGLASEGAVL